MLINSINPNYSVMNFSGRNYNKPELSESSDYQDDSSIKVHSAKKSSAKTRAVAIALAAMMALSLSSCKNENKDPSVVIAETEEAMDEMDDFSMLFLSKITPEQMAQFTPEQLIELAKALRVYNINIGEIGDNSNVQINAQVIDGTFGDGVVISFVNGSEDVVTGDGEINGNGENGDVGDVIEDSNGVVRYYMIKNGDRGYIPMTKEEATAYLGYEPTINGKTVEESTSADDISEEATQEVPEKSTEDLSVSKTDNTPDSGTYWRDQAEIISDVWADMLSKDKIVEATGKNNALNGKTLELAAFLKGVGDTAQISSEQADNEQEAQELVYENAEAFQSIYEALDDDSVLSKYGLSGCEDAIKEYIDSFEDKGDFDNDGKIGDDYKYFPDGSINPNY